jgi:hypothetical protein
MLPLSSIPISDQSTFPLVYSQFAVMASLDLSLPPVDCSFLDGIIKAGLPASMVVPYNLAFEKALKSNISKIWDLHQRSFMNSFLYTPVG